METSFLDEIRLLQRFIRSQGLGSTTISVPDSKVYAASQEDSPAGSILAQYIVDEEISEVAEDLFNSGFFSNAVEESFKVLENTLRQKVEVVDGSAEEVTRLAFSPDEPRLSWSNRHNKPERDEQTGYFHLFMGSFVALRNPIRDDPNWLIDEKEALDAIILAQHLKHRLGLARKNRPAKSSEI